MKEKRAIGSILLRSLKLLCPVCGEASIVERPFRIKKRCSVCRAVFKREEGFFVGAILANVITTELVILAVYLLSLPFFSNYDQLILAVLFVVALVFPVAFYHHSWSFWLGFDHLVESLPNDLKDDRWD
ncbi:MAG TPA: DUF983 domain-containing protein [Pyrinomonadaceae bacterium]|nr:DUF983 domain-containing protein [Pyrinomonadaceae bacterium]